MVGNRQNKKESDNEKTHIKTLSMLSETGTGGNAAMVDVNNGRITRIRPLHYDWKQHPQELNPWIVEAHGKVFQPRMQALLPPHSLGYKKRVYSHNRILYPLKRVDWNPGGERHPENRGKSGYVRISWDEATEIVASELKRVIKKYGPSAILAQADGHGETKIVHPAHACNTLLLNHLGGYTLQTRNPDSWEGWYWGAKHAWGMEPIGRENPANVVPGIAENTELILCWGADPETTSWGFAGQESSRWAYWFTELGIKQIFICPDLNYGAALHADKWIPILPNTDAALQLAIAYVWIMEGTYDKEYVATHTVGFDKFAEYVLGKEDGIAKTPNWASAKCAVPTRIIKALARYWASKRTSIFGGGGGSLRGPFSSEPARLHVLLLAMQGLGKPGVHHITHGEIMWHPPRAKAMPSPQAAYRGFWAVQQASEFHGKRIPDIVDSWNPPGWSVPPIPKPTDDAPNKIILQVIPKDLIHDALLHPPISWYGTALWSEPLEDQFQKYTYPAKGCSEIHMIWTDTPCLMTCWNDSNSIARAYQSPKIEFMLAQHPWLENDCIFADIILPANTKFEERDISVSYEQFETIILEEQCIEPIGESKSDYEIVCMIAEKLGLRDKVTEGKSVDEWIKYGFDNSRVSPLINYAQLKERQYFVIPSNPDWKPDKPFTENFYNDPNKYPLKTPSGKIEFYSGNLARYFPDDKERPPVPHWIEKSESHDERISSERISKYSLLCITNHPKWRVHANLDDVDWFHEIATGKVKGPDGYLYEPIWISSSDAAKRGIKNGDVVKVFNERGCVLVGAYVTERIMPGAVNVDHGSRYDPIVPGELDRGGAINTITPHKTVSKNATGMVVSGFLVEIEKANLDELRRKYPEAFNRPYDQASGLRFERVMQKGMR